MAKNFSGAKLRGQSFAGQALTGADFSHADIRGANFTNAILNETDFSHAIAGLQNHWIVFWLIISILTAAMAGAVCGLAGTVAAGMLQPDFASFRDYSPISGGIAWSALAIFCIVTAQRGYLSGLLTMAASLVTVSAILGTTFKILPGTGASAFVIALVVVGSLLEAIATGLIAVVTEIRIQTSIGIGSFATVVGTGLIQKLVNDASQVVASTASQDSAVSQLRQQFGALNISRAILAIVTGERWAVFSAILATTSIVGLGSYIGWKSISGDQRFAITRRMVLAIASIGGTCFYGSDLTDANFTEAILRNTRFKKAVLTRVDWFQTKGLEHAVVGSSYLNNPRILQLVRTRKGRDQNFDRMSLRGINLKAANLVDASFIGADLGETALQFADLSRAQLVQAQLDQADLTGACLTGACIQDWRISSETRLEDVQCDFIFMRLPTKDDLDPCRKPDNWREFFSAGDFADFIHPLVQTLDFYHNQGVDPRAIAIALNQLMENHPEAEIEIVAMERRGLDQDKFLLRTKTAAGVNRSQLSAEYFEDYRHLQFLPDEKLLSILAQKDRQIRLLTGMVNTALNGSQPNSRQAPVAYVGKRVMLKIGAGNFTEGFPLILQIGEDGAIPSIELPGRLPPSTDLPVAFETWQVTYRTVGTLLRLGGPVEQIQNVSLHKERHRVAQDLARSLNQWLNSEEFRPVQEKLQAKLNPSDEIRVLIQTEDNLLRRLPWHMWNWLEIYENAEIALSTAMYERVEKSAPPRHRVRVLVVLGNAEGIDIEIDRQLLESITTAETVCLVEPQQAELEQYLQDDQGWDIFCFAGHSESRFDGDTGWIYINRTESLTIAQLEKALQTGIKRGLKLAIFNSCDGLGLARQLATLHIPQIVVMKEPVPDVVAHEFLKHFITTFSSGKSLYAAVRQARERLQKLENQFFCATWLPVICQNPAEVPWTWQEFRGVGQPKVKELLAQLQAAIAADSSLTPNDQVEAFEQLQVLAAAGQNPQEVEVQKLARTAFRILRGMAMGLPSHTPVVSEFNRILPEVERLLHEAR